MVDSSHATDKHVPRQVYQFYAAFAGTPPGRLALALPAYAMPPRVRAIR